MKQAIHSLAAHLATVGVLVQQNLCTAFLQLIRLAKLLMPSFSFVHRIGAKYRREFIFTISGSGRVN